MEKYMISGIYEEIVNNKILKELDLNKESIYFDIEKMDAEEAKIFLSQYISRITKKALAFVRNEKMEDDEYLLKQIRLCNQIIELLKNNLNDNDFEDLKISENADKLNSICSKIDNVSFNAKMIRPLTSISQTSLFTGSNHEPTMLEELKKEIQSCDEIEMLVSFIKWTGLRCIIDELKEFTSNGNKLRIITTSYMEATDFKAVEELAKLPNTEIKISYDIERTRLHAKTYVFKRNSGFTTAYIGSSNMSNVALTSGLEWNVKMSEKESFEIIRKIDATFETYWNDIDFKTYTNNEENRLMLSNALNKKKLYRDDMTFNFDIHPYAYQKEILENLQAERKVFGRYKNLIVAATGVGKTVISAFDYKKFKDENPRARLLFVAHREEILKKSRDTFRYICKDLNFAELLVGANKPVSIENLFISIQSFNSSKLFERTSPDFYDYIIIDEFHHAAAKSYQTLLEYYKPKILLGLTATPERMDGVDILKYFDHSIASEMRLPEAINSKLLCPFQYFGVSDGTDLSDLKWTKGGYDISELENLYVLDERKAALRADNILLNTSKYVTDIDNTKGLGFCVSIKHAEFMAEQFNKKGIKSIALTSNTDKVTRGNANRNLATGNINFIFTVDLYNEGVDIPEINTVLFLRPTESMTVFVQQLGRGLRLCADKECLTVLDFVGQSNKNYKFADKYRSLMGSTKHSIQYYIENSFFELPKGCYIKLEKQAKEYVLRNLKGFKNSRNILISEIKSFRSDTGLELNLKNFLEYRSMNINDFYKNEITFSRLCVQAEVADDFSCVNEDFITRRLPALLSMNSAKLISFLRKYILDTNVNLNEEESIMVNMLYYTIYTNSPEKLGYSSIKQGIDDIVNAKQFREEILQILDILYEKIDFVEIKNSFDFTCPLQVHCKYSKAQILSGLEYYKKEFYGPVLEGIKYFEDKKLDVFFITLNKSEKDFSSATLYEDYAINEKLFHWETQNNATQDSKSVKRYIDSNGNSKVSLFVRENKNEYGRAASYIYLGECKYVRHYGSRPVSFIWELENDIPPQYISRANKGVL